MYWDYYHPYAEMQQRPQPQPQEPQSKRNYSEDFMEKNIGKKVTVYLTYDQNKEWNARVFTGVIRQVGRDYFVLRERSTGKDMMLLNINLNYMVFDDSPARIAKSK